MNATQQIPVVSPDAGDPVALQDPSSPASIMKRAKAMEVQTAADRKYDATPPQPLAEEEQRPREGFQDCDKEYHEITQGLLLATSVLLLLYAIAPNQG
jgi:hypothetical protein